MEKTERTYPISVNRLRELQATEAEVDLWIEKEKVHLAMQDMLRDFVSAWVGTVGRGTIKCLTPAQYQTDCGECVVCCATYRDAALKWVNKSQEERARLMAEFRLAASDPMTWKKY